MNGPGTDEISMLTALRPAPPADAEQIRQRARGRLEAALAAAPPSRAGRRSPNRRRLVLGAAGAVAAAGALIAVPAMLPGGAGSLVTKAWAVQRNSGGTITVTIPKALSDQAGLQRALRADGVPAYVRSMSGCQYWLPRGGLGQMRHDDWKAMAFPAPGNSDRNFRAIVIHPAALAKHEAIFIGGGSFTGGLSLQLFVMRNNHPPVCVPGHAMRVTKVHSAPAPG
jgi:hypothetical protein